MKMFNKLLEITKEKKIRQIDLEVNTMNHKAVNFYKSIGFEELEKSDNNLRLIYNIL